MSSDLLQPVQTASRQDSIWKDVRPEKFRKALVDLERKKRCPRTPDNYPTSYWTARGIEMKQPNDHLPFEVEQRVTDDLAFVAAFEKSAEAVSGVVLEQHLEPLSIKIKLAANHGVSDAVLDAFTRIADVLKSCARKSPTQIPYEELLFRHITELDRNRIYTRLGRRTGYNRPADDLAVELPEALLKFKKGREPNATRTSFLDDIKDLSRSYSSLPQPNGTEKESLIRLQEVIKQSHRICTSKGTRTFRETLSYCGFNAQAACENKHVRQLDKIANYWGLCLYLAKVVRKYRDIFKNITVERIEAYQSTTSDISFKNCSVTCHVHVEIQLITFYELNPSSTALQPRAIGVSKAACYLCDQFIHFHGKFAVSKTHGRLYDQWEIPDLAAFNEIQRDSYRQILRKLYSHILAGAKKPLNRPYPGESWLDVRVPMSPGGSIASTVLSDQAVISISADGMRLAALRDGETDSGKELSTTNPSTPTPERRGTTPLLTTKNCLTPSSPSQRSLVSENSTLSNVQAAGKDQEHAVLKDALPASTILGVGTQNSRRSSISLMPAITISHTSAQSSAVSSTSIGSSDLPVQRRVDAGLFFRVSIGKLSVEFEGPEEGEVTLGLSLARMDISGEQAVDVRGMRDGEVRQMGVLTKNKELLFLLHYEGLHCLRVAIS